MYALQRFFSRPTQIIELIMKVAKRRVIAIILITMSSMVAFFFFGSIRLSRLNTSNMVPAIAKNGLVLIKTDSNYAKNSKRWDIVVFYPPNKDNTKSCSRVVGLPGDLLEFSGSGLTINGNQAQSSEHSHIQYKEPKQLSEIDRKQYGVIKIEYPFRVPNNTFFLLGDNVEHSWDSRYYGPVESSSIIAKIIRVF
jgi:signal peptidase I